MVKITQEKNCKL